MFRRDVNYRHVDQELVGRALASMYGVHELLVKREARAKRLKKNK